MSPTYLIVLLTFHFFYNFVIRVILFFALFLFFLIFLYLISSRISPCRNHWINIYKHFFLLLHSFSFLRYFLILSLSIVGLVVICFCLLFLYYLLFFCFFILTGLFDYLVFFGLFSDFFWPICHVKFVLFQNLLNGFMGVL